MPRLWQQTIEAHRHAVREAILDTTWALVTQQGLLSVTMSQIAEQAGVGRATLYKYFPDVEAILLAWHERQAGGHLAKLTQLATSGANPEERLHAVLAAYAHICHHRGRHSPDLTALLHRDERTSPTREQLLDLIRSLITQAAAHGQIRDDITPSELANYCIHALGAAGMLPTRAAVERLITVTLDGLHPRADRAAHR